MEFNRLKKNSISCIKLVLVKLHVATSSKAGWLHGLKECMEIIVVKFLFRGLRCTLSAAAIFKAFL